MWLLGRAGAAGCAGMLRDYLAASAPWLEFQETTFAAYMDSFPATAVNTVMQVGHNTLRLMAMGMENRPPSAAELALMQDLLAEALEAGVLGLSSGLFTAPGCYAPRRDACPGAGAASLWGQLLFAYPR